MEIYSGKTNFNRIRNNIVFELLNLKNSSAILPNCVHDTVLDLAKVYIILSFDKKDLPTITPIDPETFKTWGIGMATLRDIADENVERLLPARIELLRGFFKRNADIDIYIASNPRQYTGASVMCYKSHPIQTFARNKKLNVLIIPCSIHELLIVEAKDFIGIEKLRDIMREFNENTNKRQEVLSYAIYRYMLKNKAIELMGSFDSMFRTYLI